MTIFPNPQIDFQIPQRGLLLSVKTCFAICGLLSPNTCQILPYVAECYTQGTVLTPHTTISARYFINRAYAIVVDFLPAHTANTPANVLTTQPHKHTTTKMSRRRPTLQWLCLLSPWVEQRYPQVMVPLLPIGTRKVRTIGLGGAAVGSPIWGANASPIKNREEGGALALGGCQSIKILNNQWIVGRSSRGDVRAEVHWWGSTWGDTIQLSGAANQMTKK